MQVSFMDSVSSGRHSSAILDTGIFIRSHSSTPKDPSRPEFLYDYVKYEGSQFCAKENDTAEYDAFYDQICDFSESKAVSV